MANLISLEIYSKKGLFFKGNVKAIYAYSSVSKLGILPHHDSLLTSLEINSFSYIDETDHKHIFAIAGGLFSISNDNATLLTSAIEEKENIDINRAIKAKERAASRLASLENIDRLRAELALKKAINRINVYNLK